MQQHGNGVSFFTRAATRNPDTHWFLGITPSQQLRQNLFLQQLKGFRIAEKSGDTNQHFAKKPLDFQGILAQIVDIIFQSLYLMGDHTPLDTATNGVAFILGKIMPCLLAQQLEDRLQLALLLEQVGLL
jgi:hypothetical protein